MLKSQNVENIQEKLGDTDRESLSYINKFLKPFARRPAPSENVEPPLNVCVMIPEPNRTQKIYRSFKKKFTRCKSKQRATANEVICNGTHSSAGSQRIVSSSTTDTVQNHPSETVISRNRRSNAVDNQENTLIINRVRFSLGLSYDRTPPPVPPRSPSTLLTVRDSNAVLRRDTEDLPPSQYIYIVGQSEETIIHESAESDGRNNSFREEYSNLLQQCYYWGPITRQEAEDKLRNQADGTFLIRDSASQRYLFSLSFRSFGKTLHTRIEHSNGKFSISDNQEFNNIVELIQQAMIDSQNSVCCFSRSRTSMDPVYPVRLITPLSRMTRIHSLKHMCRFLIRQQVNISDIDTLKLPKSVKDYLKERYL